jgi:hypothetical protein
MTMSKVRGTLEGGYNYELRDPDEPWLIVFTKHYQNDPHPYKVMRYGAVFNGFPIKAQALEWAKTAFGG